MSARTLQIAAAVLCSIFLLMAGAVPSLAAPEPPTSPEPAAVAGPEAIDAVPAMLLSYQGTLRSNSGSPDNGTHNMTAAIYDNSAGTGTALWGPETHSNVQVRDGHFSLLLGNGSPAVAIPANLFSVPTRYLKLTVDGNVLSPGQRLAAVPYAVSANYANSLAAPDGDPLAAVTVSDGGDLTVPTYAVSFGSTTRQMINLWGTGYGIGVQGYTQYFRSDSNFAWYMDGTHSDTALDPGTGGTAAMVLAGGKLGIGTTGPDRPLTIKAAGTGQQWLSFKDSSDATKWHMNYNSGTGLNFAESGVADGRLFLANGGNVGIGDTTPSAKLDVNGDINVAGHKPIVYFKITSTDHCYANFYSNYDANDWSCGLVSFKVNSDIDESGRQVPLIGAWTWVRASDNDWVFSFDIGNTCGETWEAIAMCTDNRLVQWAAQWDFPASSAAAGMDAGAENLERVVEEAVER